MSALARGLVRAAVLLAALAALVLGGAGLASAHPTLLFTDPAADTAVSETPETITLLFNEAVTIGPNAVTVLDGDGRAQSVGESATAQDGRAVTAAVPDPLPPGTYTVRWQVTGDDGDLVEQDFRFAVGIALTGGGGAGGGGPSISWLDAALRWVLFAGVALALGGVIGERFTCSARAENPALPALRSAAPAGAAVGLAAVAGLGITLVADAGGTVGALWQGRAGEVLLVEAAGLLAALLVAVAGRRGWAIAPLLLVAAAEGVRSHAQTAQPFWGAALTGIHLAAAAIWVGALLHTTRAVLVWRRVPAAVRWVLRGYMRLAAWVFAAVVITGTLSALLLIPLSQVVSTTYGQVLLVKLGLVTAGAGLALTARVLVMRAPGRLAAAARVVRAESAVLLVVLAASAVLVSTPTVGAISEPGPPPPQGPVLPLGTLAGQIGMSVTASDGQVLVRLSTPRRGDYYAPEPDQDYALTGRLDATVAEGGPLSFRGCGRGCFVAPASWAEGENVLSLRADADGWQGGTVSELLAWPPQPGADDLSRAVSQLRAAGDITVYEAVTSDTSAGAPEPQRLDLPAEFFLAQEPYADGTAPQVARISGDPGPVRLALGYPAASMNVLLTLDEQGRIGEETLTDAKHLITRRFVYPDHE
ncbi:copper resistance protein CopC/CopD (plasmid) [Rhodococcus pseudokoreensis]|uniref:Copper resistance protein CopC/CopD n=1 Tax=Rhodococcus pseudokoreensis TaxID=2811421 RepID=A0A974ZRI3_9NOCA|nr:copper resistance protein CopC [Rhodococcus pseudokoreensis]QSE87701.1 copper resistance protein CopC/CopD [Rhodococcus pseudokoreensis]